MRRKVRPKKDTSITLQDEPTMCRRCRADGDDIWHKWGWRVEVRLSSANICNAHLESSLRELVR